MLTPLNHKQDSDLYSAMLADTERLPRNANAAVAGPAPANGAGIKFDRRFRPVSGDPGPMLAGG